MLPVVAIIGRPNTGKSTLFNKLIGKRYAIESEISGTTRDRIYHTMKVRDFEVMLVDTGGLVFDELDDIEEDIFSQTQIAVDEADIILFVIDVRQELTSSDFTAADLLRKSNKACFLIANKCDHANILDRSFNLYELGFGEPIQISAIQNIGLEHIDSILFDKLGNLGFKPQKNLSPSSGIHIGFFGKPNVGKSSLVNSFLNEHKLLVSDVPGTTRDTTDTPIEYNGTVFNLIDTAGLRRKSTITKKLERYSVLKSFDAITRCDIALLIMDYLSGISHQDLAISHYILEEGKGLIIVINKSDLMQEDDDEQIQWISSLKRRFQYVPWAPVIFVSALTKKNIHILLDLVKEIYEERQKRIKISEFNAFIEKIKYEHEPKRNFGVKQKIYYASQIGSSPPHFVFIVSDRDSIHFSYKRYIENRLREKYGFRGTAIRLDFRNKKAKEA